MMITRNSVIMVAIALLAGGWLAPSGWAQGQVPLQHPEEEGDLRICSQCHDTERGAFPYRRYEHTPLFGEKHRLTAMGSRRVCEMCHQASFCADCHGAGAGLRPSFKQHGDTRRRMPHRGDYLTRHRIDGRLRPAKCFSCHGRPKSAATCRPCHG